MPRPLLATAHLHVRAVEQTLARLIKRCRGVDANRQRHLSVGENKHAAETHCQRTREGVSHLSFDRLERRLGRSIANRKVSWQTRGVLGVVSLAPGLNAIAELAGDKGDEDAATAWSEHLSSRGYGIVWDIRRA